MQYIFLKFITESHDYKNLKNKTTIIGNRLEKQSKTTYTQIISLTRIKIAKAP